MDPDALPAFLETLQGQVATAASPAANAMAEVTEREVQLNLHRQSHAPGVFHRAIPGQPPARASGHLAQSMFIRSAIGNIRATAIMGNTAVYAGIQEFGGWTEPTRHLFMKWTNTGGTWYMPHVDIPEHPYIKPAVERTIADGSMQRSAISAFMARMSPLIR